MPDRLVMSPGGSGHSRLLFIGDLEKLDFFFHGSISNCTQSCDPALKAPPDSTATVEQSDSRSTAGQMPCAPQVREEKV